VNGFDQPNGSGWQSSRDYFELRLLLSTNAFWPERAEHSFRVLGVTVTQSVSALNQVLFEKPQLELTGLLFPNAKGTHPRWRDNVVKYGLKPVLKQLGIQAKDTGLHAFRHGLATELAEQAVPLTVLRQQMRHADIKTTLRIYAHAIPQTQRDVMERLKGLSIGTSVPFAPSSRN